MSLSPVQKSNYPLAGNGHKFHRQLIDLYFIAGDWCDFRVFHCGLHRFFLPQDSPGHAGTGDTQHNSADFV